MTQALSEPSGLLELVHQPVVGPQGEVHGLGFVVVRVQVEVLDDVCEEVGALPAAPGHLVAQLGEVDVQVVVGRLVVQVDPQLAGWKLVALQDGLLERGKDETAQPQLTHHHHQGVAWLHWISALVTLPVPSCRCSSAEVGVWTSGPADF